MSARALAFFLSTVVLAACAQTEGEICQLAEDCEGDLVCCKLSGSGDPSARGVCETESACAASMVVDATVPQDAGGRDAQVTGPGLGRPCQDAALTCATGLICFRGVCLLPDGTDGGAIEVDSGTDAGVDGGPEDAGGDDAGLDGGP